MCKKESYSIIKGCWFDVKLREERFVRKLACQCFALVGSPILPSWAAMWPTNGNSSFLSTPHTSEMSDEWVETKLNFEFVIYVVANPIIHRSKIARIPTFFSLLPHNLSLLPCVFCSAHIFSLFLPHVHSFVDYIPM